MASDEEPGRRGLPLCDRVAQENSRGCVILDKLRVRNQNNIPMEQPVGLTGCFPVLFSVTSRPQLIGSLGRAATLDYQSLASCLNVTLGGAGYEEWR